MHGTMHGAMHGTTDGRSRVWALLIFAVVTLSGACSVDSIDEAPVDDGEADDDAKEHITNACGTFEVDDPNAPQDPDSTAIVEACSLLCEVLDELNGCATDTDECTRRCTLRSCEVCPNTLVPLIDCELAETLSDTCSCANDLLECPSPPKCYALVEATLACMTDPTDP